MKSAIYTGILHHRRTAPKVHDFKYQLALFYLDLDELDSVFSVPFFFSNRSPRLIGFKRSDYLAGKGSLKESVLDLVEKKTGERPKGPVRMLSQLRYLGFCFNPVTFYYCFDEAGVKLEYIAAEITNTPWNERKPYGFKFDGRDFEFKKDFHVSPFFKMNLHYVWRFNEPAPDDHESKIRVRMEDWEMHEQGHPTEQVFEANLILKPQTLTRWNVIKTVLGFPLLTFKAFLAIYWQALCIYLKRVPFIPHPRNTAP
jgi:DUF1365 family protein